MTAQFRFQEPVIFRSSRISRGSRLQSYQNHHVLKLKSAIAQEPFNDVVEGDDGIQAHIKFWRGGCEAKWFRVELR
jgi:hypothetical protein